MKPKTIVGTGLLAFAGMSVVVLIAKEAMKPDETPPAAAGPSRAAGAPVATDSAGKRDVAKGASRTVVYYFHGSVRCRTCRAIEAYAKEAVETGFADLLRGGDLEWRVVNVEEPGNKHFIKDFQLVSRSVVVAEMEGDRIVRWKNLARVWELVVDKNAFVDYVRREVREHAGAAGASLPEVVREEPLVGDNRPPEARCFMCGHDVDAKTKVTVRSPAGGLTHLCSPHCYFILESCLVDKSSVAEVAATDYASGRPVPFAEAVWLYGADESGRPTIRAFSSRDSALAEMRRSGGSTLALDALRDREYAVRCGFCDRAMYRQDNGSKVRVSGGTQTYGCCPHCALGVAARLRRNIVVKNNDPISGELIRIETFNGQVKSLDPPTAVAWFGQKRRPDGTMGSAGCFHQWNFTSVANLRKWLETHPRETGRLITIHQALAAKMKMSPEKIKKACKIGECK